MRSMLLRAVVARNRGALVLDESAETTIFGGHRASASLDGLELDSSWTLIRRVLESDVAVDSPGATVDQPPVL
jgi:hypothetical protein